MSTCRCVVRVRGRVRDAGWGSRSSSAQAGISGLTPAGPGAKRLLRSDRVTNLLAVLCAVTIVSLLAAQVLRAIEGVHSLAVKRGELARLAPELRPDALSVIEDDAGAFRRFHPLIRPSDRFVVVVGKGRSDPGRYQLVSQYYFYPAQAVASVAGADVVIVIGERPGRRPSGFVEVASSGGVWLGRKSS